MNEIIKVTNIGIPCYSPITFPVGGREGLTLVCSTDKTKTIKIEREIRQEGLNRIDKVLGTTSPNRNRSIISEINFYADDNSISRFNLDCSQRLINIFDNLLELHREPMDAMLKKIKTSKESLDEFVLYLKRNPYSRELHEKLKSSFPNIYTGRSYNYDLRKYLNEESNFYDAVLENSEQISKIDYSDMFDYYTESLNKEKVLLFLANEYIINIRNCIYDGNQKLSEEYFLFLSAFIRSGIDKKSFIIIDGYKLTYDDIKNEYERLLNLYPFIKDVYYRRNFFVNKNKEDNVKVIDSLVNMKTIDEEEFFIKGGHNNKKKEEITKRDTEPVSIEEEKEIEAYLDQKYYAFLRNNPVAKIICENKFSNYEAFMYENGIIIADRLRGINRLSEIQNDAIYVFDASNFHEKIKLNKQQLIGNTKRIFHIPGWIEEVEKISKRETSDELKESAKKLIIKK